LLSRTRPVGERFSLKKSSFDVNLFAPFHYLGTQSGTAALCIALRIARQMRSDVDNPEVLMPAYTCPDVISACITAGVTPVLIDFAPDTCHMSLDELSLKCHANTVAIIAINFLGIPERIDQIRSLLNNKKTLIIEDSAQGFPRSDKENYWKGDLVTLSFGRGKPLGLFNGGAVLSRQEELLKMADAFLSSSSKLSEFSYRIKHRVFNMLMSPLGYGLLTRLPGMTFGETLYKPLEKCEHINPTINEYLSARVKDFEQRRVELYDLYNKRLEQLNLSILGSGHSLHEYLRIPVLLPNQSTRNACLEKLDLIGLGATAMYKKILTEFDDIPIDLGDAPYPNASLLAQRLITLPLHQDVSEQDIDEMMAVIEAEVKNAHSLDK